MNDEALVRGLRDIVSCDSNVCRVITEAADRIEALIASSSPSRPAPRYREGDTFVSANCPSRWAVVVGEPAYNDDTKIWRYNTRGPDWDHTGNAPIWTVEIWVDGGHWLPAPPRPQVAPDSERVPGECREPKDGESWFCPCGECDDVYHEWEGTRMRIAADGEKGYDGRRWIAELRKLTGEAWLNAVKPGTVFEFRGEPFAVEVHEGGTQPYIAPLLRRGHYAFRDKTRPSWSQLDYCFQGHVDDLSDETATVLTFRKADKEEG